MQPEQELRHLVNTIPQVLFQTDETGTWTFLNAAWEEATGYSPSESLGRPFPEFIDQDDVEQAFHLFHLLQQAERETLQAQIRFRHQDGHVRWFDVFARAHQDEAGSFIGTSGTFTDITERRRLDDELRMYREKLEEMVKLRTAELQEINVRRTRQVALSTRLAQAIAGAADLDDLYEQVVEQVNEAFGYYYTQLLRYNSLEEAVVLVAGSGHLGERMLASGHRMALGAGLIGTAAASGRALLRSDVNKDPAWQPNPILPQTRGELAVPIRLGDELLGVIDVQSDKADALGEEDQLLLEGLSGQIATAIESTRLRQETEERLQELDNLQRLMSRDAWLKYRSSQRQEGAGFLFDRHEIHVLAQEPARPSVQGNGQEAAIRPLAVRGERFGVLGVKDDPENPLTTEEVELLDAISRQVAEALENARLLQQTQKRAVELETVSRVSAATATILEADKLLRAVVELTRRSFDLYHAHVYLLDQASAELRLVAGSGAAGDGMVEQGWRIPVDHANSVVARVARERQGIIVNDVRASAHFLANPLLPATRAELAVPMIVGNRLLGVLDVQADEAHYFGDEDVQIQSALASQVAIALQNATLYQEQLKTTDQLREFDRLKSEFLASMSHELRTPLNSIIGFADVLLEGIDGELNERMEEDVRLIRNSGDHLRNLIGDILDMSKIEAGMMDLRYETIDVTALANELDSFARSQMITYDRTLDFRVEIDEEVEHVMADRTRFKQVLFNLISNAVKFTAEGEIAVQIAVADDFLKVSVADTGIGIKEENIDIVFEQFRQVDGSLTRTAGGTGLGLPISKSLVELHGGDIFVESKVGEGTRFTFTIPVDGRRRRAELEIR